MELKNSWNKQIQSAENPVLSEISADAIVPALNTEKVIKIKKHKKEKQWKNFEGINSLNNYQNWSSFLIPIANKLFIMKILSALKENSPFFKYYCGRLESMRVVHHSLYVGWHVIYVGCHRHYVGYYSYYVRYYILCMGLCV